MTISRKLVPGDRVHDMFYAADSREGAVISHPTDNNKIVVVFGDHANVFDNDYPLENFDRDWVIVDEAKEEWDKLVPELRSQISWLGANTTYYVTSAGDYGLGKKITAIKLLRAVSGLGLSDAKRAVENFIE